MLMAAQRTLLDWDDLRLVLAVAESGTLSGAAVALRLSHPTVARRLRAAEQRLGARLFDRTPSRCRPTAAGEEMVAVAARLRDEVAALEARIAGRDRDPGGPVRLTAPDAVSEYLLPPLLADLCRSAPDLVVELVVANAVLSLARREADIALRVTDAPDPGLRGRRVGTVAMAVYAAAALVDGGLAGDPGARPWVGYDGGLACSGPGAWMARQVPEGSVRFRANTLLGAARAVRSGLGCGVLPCFVGGSLPDLVAVSPPLAGLEQGLWLLVHPQVAAVPRVRAARDALARRLKGAAPLLTGAAP